MPIRPPEDYADERNALYQAFAQNEAGRDTFVGLAHTALFASSVAFVGDVRPLGEAIVKPLLAIAWGCNLVGLLTLAISFSAARRHIVARIAAMNSDEPPQSRWADLPNAVSLWCVPASLLCLFLFVTMNMWDIDEPKANSAASTEAGTAAPTKAGIAENRTPRFDPAATRAPAVPTGIRAGGSATGAKSANPISTTTPASTAQKEIVPVGKGGH